MSEILPPPPPSAPQPDAHMNPRERKATAKGEKARAKAMRPWYRKKRFWALGIVAVIVIAALAGSSGGDDTSKTATDAPTPTTIAGSSGSTAAVSPTATSAKTGSGQTVYTLGQQAHTGDLDVTLNTVKDPYASTNQFDKPSAGQRFVAVEVTVKNTGKSAVTVSSLLFAEVTDSQSRPWRIALAGLDLPQLDGQVQPGDSRRGWMVFGVDQDATGLRMRLKGSLTATGSVFGL
jgi:hypothetical protein